MSAETDESESMHSSTGEYAVRVLSLVAFLLLLLVYRPFLLQERDFAGMDLSFIYEPFCRYVGDSLRSGRFPLWNDMVYNGIPQIAVISPGVFYCPNFLLFLLPLSFGLSIYMILHQLICSLGLYFYMRKMGISSVGALCAGVCAAAGGYFFSMIKYPDYAGVAWVPVLCLVVSQFFSGSGLRALASLLMVTLSTAMLILSGRPENFIAGLFLAGVQVLVESFKALKQGLKIEKLGSFLFFIGCSFICGISFAAPIIFPELEWLGYSPRSAGFSEHELFKWSTTWYDWLSLVFLEPLGDLQLVSGFSELLPLWHREEPFGQPLLATFYLGAGYCACVLIGMMQFRWRPLRCLLPLLVFFALLSAGSQSSFAPAFFHAFPKLAVIRYPVKLLIFPVLLSVPIAARGIESVLSKSVGRSFLIVAGLLQLFCFLILNFPGINLTRSVLLSMANAAGSTLSESTLAQASMHMSESLSIGFALLFTLSVLILLYQCGLIRKQFFQPSLFALLFIPLAVNGIGASARSCAFGFYEHVPSIIPALEKCAKNRAQDERIACFGGEGNLVIGREYTELGKIPSGISTLLFLRDGLDYNHNMNFGLRSSSGYEGQPIGAYARLLEDAEWLSPEFDKGPQAVENARSDLPYARFCSVSGTNIVLTRTHRRSGAEQKLLDSSLFTLLAENTRLDTRIYRVASSSRRFYFAEKLQILTDWNRFAELILDPRPNSFDARAAYTDARSFSVVAPLLNAKSLSRADVSVSPRIDLLKDQPEHITLCVQKRFPGLLVVRDQFYPGWKARIDGKETPIVRVNLVNRAIAVPAGRHEVEFDYLPESLFNGLKLAAGGIVGAFILAIIFFRFSRHISNDN